MAIIDEYNSALSGVEFNKNQNNDWKKGQNRNRLDNVGIGKESAPCVRFLWLKAQSE